MLELAKFAAVVAKVQWLDRKATSFFLIGITLQTAVLSRVCWMESMSLVDGMVNAVSCASLTCVTIALIAAMSIFTNEFRYGTTEQMVLGRYSVLTLFALRSISTIVVSLPAILVPALTVMVKFGAVVDPWPWLVVIALTLVLMASTFQFTLILAVLPRPSVGVLWLRLAVLILGLSLVPYPGHGLVQQVLPLGLTHLVAASGTTSMTQLGWLAGCTTLWTIAAVVVSHSLINHQIDRALLDGRLAE